MSIENAKEQILVVEDMEATRYTVCRYLKSAGFEVWEASTGRQALDLVADQPSLVLLDVNLPDMMGYDVCREIKSNPSTAAIPVLHTSASFVTTQDKAIGLEKGADAYLTWPVEPEELIATIHALLRMRKAEAQAQLLANQWQATFDAMGDGICLLDRRGRIQRCNAAFHAVLGREGVDFSNSPFEEVLRDVSIEATPYARMLQSRKRETMDARKRDCHLRITADPVNDDHGNLSGAVCILHDVTERKRTEAALQEAMDQLGRINEQLDQKVRERTASLEASLKSLEGVLYHVAHDLRAPLRSMHSFTQLLVESCATNLDATGEEYTNIILEASKKMDLLILDLLNYGRLGYQKVILAPVDLTALVERLLAEVKNEVTALEALIQVDGPLPKVWADSRILEQVLANLIGNGLKFVRPGAAPRLHLWAEAGAGTVRLYIEDSGIGIAPEYQERIFWVFERLHTESDYPGTGIGLAIVKKGMERLGGRVGLESRPRKGSRFWLELPVPPPDT